MESLAATPMLHQPDCYSRLPGSPEPRVYLSSERARTQLKRPTCPCLDPEVGACELVVPSFIALQHHGTLGMERIPCF
jgi:hypothetical protein